MSKDWLATFCILIGVLVGGLVTAAMHPPWWIAWLVMIVMILLFSIAFYVIALILQDRKK